MRKMIMVLFVALLPFVLCAQSEEGKESQESPEGMVLIPEGEFWMGSSEEEAKIICDAAEKAEYNCMIGMFENEQPKHKVVLDAYYIDKYEVTNAQYKECVSAGKCEKPLTSSSYEISWFDDESYTNHPVMDVGWSMADAYCAWAEKRLPTEAEWEKAARGPDGNFWPWGNTGDENKCNSALYKGSLTSQMAKIDEDRGTTPVGSFSEDVSFYGVMDMAGNVREWVADWYGGEYYKDSPEKNPKGPDKGESHVCRGGAWDDGNPISLRGAQRNQGQLNGDIISNGGFRCAKSSE